VTGVALPTLNGVWAHGADVRPDIVGDLLDQVAATALPYCLQVRPAAADGLAGPAAARGMTPAGNVPLMALAGPANLPTAAPLAGLTVRELLPAEAHLHAEMTAAGFELPAEPFRQLVTPAMLSAPGVRCYLGEVDGRAVATGLSLTSGAYAAIFNIATLPAYRRRGYGAAVTTRAVADGIAAGAEWSWLQASEAGYPVYRRLGFRTVEDWPSWVSGAGGNGE
jgi:ribosomal protein S18 acetylase RimI-like enzyme